MKNKPHKKQKRATPLDYVIATANLFGFIGLAIITYFLIFNSANFPLNFMLAVPALSLLFLSMPEYDKLIWRKPQTILGRNTVWILTLSVSIVFILLLWGYLAGVTCTGIMGAKWSCAASVYYVLMFTVFHPFVFLFIAAPFIGIFLYLRIKQNNPR